MSGHPAAKRPRGRATATNILITAASLALTMSGWAVLTGAEADPVQAVAVPASTPAPLALIELPPLPTLVPAPRWDDTPASSDVRSLPHPPAAVAAAPDPRRIVAPARAPRPVTMTRSSR